MISDGIRNGIEAILIYRIQRIIAGIKEGNNARIGRDSSSSQHVRSQRNLSKNKIFKIWMCKFRVVRKQTNECVRKRKVLMYNKQCVQHDKL